MLPAEVATTCRSNLVRNLEAARLHRPRLHAALVAAGGGNPWRLTVGPHGDLTLADGQGVLAMPGGDPRSHARAVLAELLRLGKTEHGLGLAGIGDGTVLAGLAEVEPELANGRRYPSIIAEPDAALLWLALALHDLSGDGGAIVGSRGSRGASGPGFESALVDLADDPDVVFPDRWLPGGAPGPEVDAVVAAANRAIVRRRTRDFDRRQALWRAEAAMSPRRSASRPRRARTVRLGCSCCASRFTTVLQYGAAHLRDAFARAGWDASLDVEPHPAARLASTRVLHLLERHRPDLLVLFNATRHGFQGLIPEGLPVLAWIQDQLASVENGLAAAGVGPRDEIVTGAAPYLARTWGYPADRLVSAKAFTAMRPGPTGTPRCDLLYVSHARRTADGCTRRRSPSPGTTAWTPGSPRRASSAWPPSTTGRRGDDLAGAATVLRGVAGGRPGRPRPPRSTWPCRSPTPLCPASRPWDGRPTIAERRGLSLSICGKGWAEHPRFAPFAGDPIAPARRWGPACARLGCAWCSSRGPRPPTHAAST